MAKSEFTEVLASGRRLFLDGAMGTMLQAAGMPAGMGPERFCLERPEILKGIHLAYLRAGSNIITTCTFGASIFKMPSDMDVEAFNCEMALIARQAIIEAGCSGPQFVAGNVGPTGKFASPLGDVAPGEMIAAFEQQIRGLARGGCDLIFMETQFDLAETRAAVVAARRVCDLPVMVSMTFEEGVSLTGSTPQIFAETMQNLGCAVVGVNCSLGPDEMEPVVGSLLDACAAPVMAEPNAGLPVLEGGRTVFRLGAEDFARKTARFAQMGVQILGGCCGTTPEHIAALRNACGGMAPVFRDKARPAGIVLTSRSSLVRIGPDQPLAIIGERINPTGKPKLAAQLAEGQFQQALALADAQIQAGADVLDVNVGAPHVDEERILPQLASLLVSRQLAPLSLDSSDCRAIAAALPVCPGSCLVNSISGEKNRLEELGPLCRDFGAPFILLPITGARLPEKADERIAILEKLLEKTELMGIPASLVLVDVLAMSIAASPHAGRECIETLRWCCERNLATTFGLSNISFGMPARELINATFLTMARGAGLSSCIANPGAPRVAEAMAAINMLSGMNGASEDFVARFAEWKPDAQLVGTGAKAARAETLHDAVLAGDRENILSILEKDLAAGLDPMSIVNDSLIPAINEVGELYEKKKYFLPQLIRSAETMRAAFERLRPLLAKSGQDATKPVIVMATVEGDIHDIGKNIVALLLGNHGFEVIDAGKDVPASRIVACAKEHGAVIVGLSALMTTTMVRMKDTIDLIRKEGLPMRVMVGGAAVTPEFARSIGADAYSADAVEAVKTARGLLEGI